MMLKTFRYLGIITIGAVLASCAAGVDDTGLEYAPQMYHSTPYEPLTQITNEEEGSWLDSNDEDGHGEFYNSNPYNQFKMNMREPVANTVRRGEPLPVRMTIDDLEIAAQTLESPFPAEDEGVVKEGKALYDSYCKHCHGAKGNADGLVADKYAGVANLNGAAYLEITEGHIFHVITYGKGLMGAHGSQVSPEDRWRIARYVKELQKSN
ncbi:cytochrome c [Ekhidna sp.]|jgi:mono/diheme cytochrome c family protein|uniref:c-type cytochrome n=1 Tax=Ekhidna sp. TaxID=2608089 RepID=UPI0032EF1BF4